ncbi:hypothetical protein DPMN_005548 [Dreissena polymorpha]|uniref:Uncharacterized protein n=1 Tax=Dreissena polymorpha TaxID=45954 RepID=A0A9D4MUU9_DREPO|nr:hypothetical protein DPMN_005548 [Dreissena polymorpha]
MTMTVRLVLNPQIVNTFQASECVAALETLSELYGEDKEDTVVRGDLQTGNEEEKKENKQVTR